MCVCVCVCVCVWIDGWMGGLCYISNSYSFKIRYYLYPIMLQLCLPVIQQRSISFNMHAPFTYKCAVNIPTMGSMANGLRGFINCFSQCLLKWPPRHCHQWCEQSNNVLNFKWYYFLMRQMDSVAECVVSRSRLITGKLLKLERVVVQCRAFAYGAIDRQIDPSGGPTELFPVLIYPVCGMVHIKDPFLLIRKSSRCSDGSRFPSRWSFTICRRHITVTKMCWVRRLMKHFLPSLTFIIHYFLNSLKS